LQKKKGEAVMKRIGLGLVILTLLSLVASNAQGRIKLVALPDRDATIIRLDNPYASLVEEERVLTLQKGVNKVDFSWKGVRIDPDSIRLRVLSHPNAVQLLSVSFPPNEAALVWEIASPEGWEERVRISYLLSGIDRLVEYRARTEKDEKNLTLNAYMVLRNFSGEDFERARVFLNSGKAFEKTIQNEETKRMLFLTAGPIPITKTYTWDAAVKAHDPEKVSETVGIPVHYVMENKVSDGLGGFGLWAGKARIFQDDGYGTTIFIGEDRAAFTPVGDRMELYIGDTREIKVTQRKMFEKKINIRRNKHNKVVLCDTDELFTVKVENFKNEPIVLTLIEHIPGQWDVEKASFKYEKETANRIKFLIPVPANGSETVSFHYHRRNVR
jgi:hypothetical protein